MRKFKKAQTFLAGRYRSVEVIGKYGRTLELPDEYEVVVTPLRQKPTKTISGKTRSIHRKPRAHAILRNVHLTAVINGDTWLANLVAAKYNELKEGKTHD